MIYIVEIDCICLFALIFVVRNMRRKSGLISSSKYIYFAGYVTMLVIIADILSLLLEGRYLGPLNRSRLFNYVINIVYYLGSVGSSFLWFLHVEYTIDDKFWSKKKHIRIALIPSYFSAIFCFMSIFNGVYFTIDADNHYVRGPLFFVNNAICFLYAFVCCGHAFASSYRASDYMKKKQYRLLACYILFPVLFSLIQMFLPHVPTILVGMTIPVIYIYTELLDLQISTDYLTNLNNRNQLMRYLDMRMANPSKEKDLYLFVLDVDSFKKINDEFGHAEGDQALRKTADILRGAAKKFGGFVARYGGDEFTYVVELEKPETVGAIKAYFESEPAAVSKNQPYALGLSVGCAKYKPSLKIQELLSLADEDMYKTKTMRKKSRGV